MKRYIAGIISVVILTAVSLVFCLAAPQKNLSSSKTNYWKAEAFVQPHIDVSRSEAGVIKARVDGKWQDFKIRQLPDGFIKWKRTAALKSLERMQKGGPMSIAGAGHHFGAVATKGGHRDDADFSINNAFKGIGFLPRKDKIKEAIKKLRSTRKASPKEKINVLKGFRQAKDFIDRTKLCSLELYTTKKRQTHTFLNIIADPSVSIVFLDIPSYEVRAICQLVHPADETASQYHRDILTYVNLLHDYFHGKSPRDSIVMIFHVNQVFDNSPRSKGARVTP
ncbi:MAG: hypothetical protein KAV00_04450 [Phycisphaerae bacterium]|nr:hypothetical protein [Phycisphaerae bacterium]